MDQLPFFGTGLAASQVVSVLFIVASLAALVVGHLNVGKSKPAPAKKRRRKK